MSVLHSLIDTRGTRFLVNAQHYGELLGQLRDRIAVSAQRGPKRRRERHRSRGKLLARERIDRLLDPDTRFLELSPLTPYGMYDGGVSGAGIVTGIGVISGLLVVIIANDATVKDGSFFHERVKKHMRAHCHRNPL